MSPPRYAQNTRVPISQSRHEIEHVLLKYGADQFSAGWTESKAVVMFRAQGRYVRIEIPMPGKKSPNQEKETKRRWRALVLYVKAKLESVESEIMSFEQAFMAHIVLPDSKTVGEFMQPQIESAYQSGKMPKQLPGY